MVRNGGGLSTTRDEQLCIRQSLDRPCFAILFRGELEYSSQLSVRATDIVLAVDNDK